MGFSYTEHKDKIRVAVILAVIITFIGLFFTAGLPTGAKAGLAILAILIGIHESMEMYDMKHAAKGY